MDSYKSELGSSPTYPSAVPNTRANMCWSPISGDLHDWPQLPCAYWTRGRRISACQITLAALIYHYNGTSTPVAWSVTHWSTFLPSIYRLCTIVDGVQHDGMVPRPDTPDSRWWGVSLCPLHTRPANQTYEPQSPCVCIDTSFGPSACK